HPQQRTQQKAGKVFHTGSHHRICPCMVQRILFGAATEKGAGPSRIVTFSRPRPDYFQLLLLIPEISIFFDRMYPGPRLPLRQRCRPYRGQNEMIHIPPSMIPCSSIFGTLLAPFTNISVPGKKDCLCPARNDSQDPKGKQRTIDLLPL